MRLKRRTIHNCLLPRYVLWYAKLPKRHEEARSRNGWGNVKPLLENYHVLRSLCYVMANKHMKHEGKQKERKYNE